VEVDYMQQKPVLPGHSPGFIAIVGGSGAGKTRLAEILQRKLDKETLLLSLDDFYRDRSQLSPHRRELINFDHPRAIDWASLEKVLVNLRRRRTVQIPRYDFATHSRLPQGKQIPPRSIIIVEGLWLLRPASIRKQFDFAIYLDCPQSLRLKRRLARDLKTRGRNEASIRRQFRASVAPMHDKFVEPQIRWATLVLRHDPSAREIEHLIQTISTLRKSKSTL
jgi:uridine kinase